MAGSLVILAGCQGSNIDPSDTPRQTVRGIVAGGKLSIYISNRPLTDADLATIARGGKVGWGWAWFQSANGAWTGECDLSSDTLISYAAEWPTHDPYTEQPTTMRIDLVGGEPGLTGYIRSEVADDATTRFTYHVHFKGLKPFRVTTPEPIDYETINGGQFVPEMRR